MEDYGLNRYQGAILSLLLGIVPDLASLNTWSDLLLKWLSLVSVGLIVFLNLKKLRSNAPA